MSVLKKIIASAQAKNIIVENNPHKKGTKVIVSLRGTYVGYSKVFSNKDLKKSEPWIAAKIAQIETADEYKSMMSIQEGCLNSRSHGLN